MIVFDGEKTPFEMGQPKALRLDYYSLRLRAWEGFIKSDVIQNSINKYCLWLMGSGLKIQAYPIESVIDNPQFNLKEFSKKVEANFRLFSNSRESVYNNMLDLHLLAIEALKNAMLAGDVLVVTRVVKKKLSVELIDGGLIESPWMDSTYYKDVETRGNQIKNGVEVDAKGTHIAFYVKSNIWGDYTRVPAFGEKTGKLTAWLMYGRRSNLNETRGMSLLTAVLETSAKMDRYKEATIGTAEENAKLVYTVEHDHYSDGSNPLINQLAQASGRGTGTTPESKNPEIVSENIATKIAQTTEKAAYNMPIGAKLVQHGGKSDINFGEFFGINSDLIYSTLGIPPEVAADKFGGAYSGSRAALKSWEYKMFVDRVNLIQKQFYALIYDLWLDLKVLNNEISVPGYLEAYINKDTVKLSAYKNARFIGAGVPHIDPLKEVKAEREKLGGKYANVPLTTGDMATETLNTGDFESNLEIAKREMELFQDEFGMDSPAPDQEDIIEDEIETNDNGLQTS